MFQSWIKLHFYLYIKLQFSFAFARWNISSYGYIYYILITTCNWNYFSRLSMWIFRTIIIFNSISIHV